MEWSPIDLHTHSTLKREYPLPWPFSHCEVQYFVLLQTETRLTGWCRKRFYDLAGRLMSETESPTGQVFDSPEGHTWAEN